MNSPIYGLLADDLSDNLDRFIDLVAQHTLAELPEIMNDAERTAFARTGARSLLTDFIAVLEMGVVHAQFHAPAAAIALAQRFARDGIPIAVMLRAYRLGQELVFERAAKLAEQIPEADQRSGAVASLGALSFRYMDGVMSDVSQRYDAERENAFRGRDARRQALVRDLLAGLTVDPAEAEQILGHRVDGHHLAVVAWSTDRGCDSEALDTAAQDVASALGDGRSLAVGDTSGEVTVWVRPNVGDASELAAECDVLLARNIQVAIGEPGRGLRGFAATKRQADLARSVAQLRPGILITRYADVALAAVLLRDQDVARNFAEDELGRLAHANRSAAILRTTLAIYYSAGQDQSRAARQLGLHRNTVANRLRRAEESLGHPTDQRAREIEAALVILDALPSERSVRSGA